jgi:predicted nucleotidyltransferase
MLKKKKILDFAKRVAREFHPDQIILFGSYAHGKPTRDSDVDLLVIMPFAGLPAAKAVEIRLKAKPGFPLDLLVRTPEKVRERLALGDDFMREIQTQGEVLYEAPHR